MEGVAASAASKTSVYSAFTITSFNFLFNVATFAFHKLPDDARRLFIRSTASNRFLSELNSCTETVSVFDEPELASGALRIFIAGTERGLRVESEILDCLMRPGGTLSTLDSLHDKCSGNDVFSSKRERRELFIVETSFAVLYRLVYRNNLIFLVAINKKIILNLRRRSFGTETGLEHKFVYPKSKPM